MIRIGTKVRCTPRDCAPFIGKIEMSMKWTNPFAIFDKKGVTYHVRAEDDKNLYEVDGKFVNKI